MANTRWWIGLTALTLAAVNAVIWQLDSPETFEVPVGGPSPELGAFIVAEWRGQAVPAPKQLLKPNLGIYLSLRKEGMLSAETWEFGGEMRAAAMKMALLRARDQGQAKDSDTVVGCLVHDFTDGPSGKLDNWNVHRGVRGLELKAGSVVERVSPLEMLARNVGPEALVEEFIARHPGTPKKSIELRSFECDAFWVPLGKPEAARMILRGNDLIRMTEVTRPSVTGFFNSMSDWMFANLMDDGRMLYKWWPSRAEESPGNNQIRQWMASIALLKVASVRKDPALLERATANLRYNLAHFYREENGLGIINEEGKVKLGAIALAALALHSHPDRAQFAREEQTLIATTEAMQDASGAFQTMYAPKDSSRPFQNFYTGEALLLWATLYHDQPEPARLARFLKSFYYYRNWHRSQRNPAFVPWHTQADYLVWQKTRDPELADFIFEMNDWLLDVQDWDNAAYVNMRGQFYDAERPELGPPHASSIGVYLEGLADAYALAVELKDDKRAKAYQRAILRGLRASMQLQFVDDVDLFYVTPQHRARSVGGLRSRVYNNEIRVDNVQHTLLATDKLMKTTVLPTSP